MPEDQNTTVSFDLCKGIAAGTLLIIVLISHNATAFAEREIHAENSDGSVTITVERTPHEQVMAKNAYTQPDGSTMYYLDNAGQPITREAFQKKYDAEL